MQLINFGSWRSVLRHVDHESAKREYKKLNQDSLLPKIAALTLFLTNMLLGHDDHLLN